MQSTRMNKNTREKTTLQETPPIFQKENLKYKKTALTNEPSTHEKNKTKIPSLILYYSHAFYHNLPTTTIFIPSRVTYGK